MAGREDEARKAVEKALQREPNLSVAIMAKMYGNNRDGPIKRGRFLIDELRKAGLPE